MASGLWRLKMLAAASVAALLAACATPPPTIEELEAQAWVNAQRQDSPFA
jgi:starvation-inducible outer membrane lipoprotein